MVKELTTERLLLKRPTMNEQYDLWNIVRKEEVNRYYFPIPNRIINKYNFNKTNIDDLKEARKIFMMQFNDWNKQIPFYEKKIEAINREDNSQKYTWSIFLKNGEIIGQITVQPNDEYIDNPKIRDIGWFIDPKYQRMGYASEAARAVVNYMFNEEEIEAIITGAATINCASWKLMEKLGFERTKEKVSSYYDDNDNILNCYCYELTRNKIIK